MTTPVMIRFACDCAKSFAPVPVSEYKVAQKRALLICGILTFFMMLAEFIAGYLTHSLMLVSDAIHMMSHTGALTVSLVAVNFATKKADHCFPFGLYRIEILAAFLNGLGLIAFSSWIMYEAVNRMLSPQHVLSLELTLVATMGLAVNLVTALILKNSDVEHEDLNTKSAFFHMVGDAFSSVAILIGGIVIMFTEWDIIDPMLSLVVAGWVGRWSYSLLRDSVLILMERKPDHLHVDDIQQKLSEKFLEIKGIHDLHIWEITSQFVCLSAHIVISDTQLSDARCLQINMTQFLRETFGIGYVVIQLEPEVLL